MCLILIAVYPNDQEKLIVAANRDEQHARPTRKADYWQDNANILGGRDLQAGGTWLGVANSGRFAAVTNFAEEPPQPLPPRSRGELTSNFLMGETSCEDYLQQVDQEALEYRGFNLIISEGKDVFYYSNRERQVRQLQPGFYGLSNQLLDCDWPKVISARAHLEQLAPSFDTHALFDLLACRGDNTAFSARFILGEQYGTGASTVVKMNHSGIYFEERNFNNKGQQTDSNNYQISY